MKNVNIGIVNLVVSNKLRDSYFKNEMVTESKEEINELLNVVKTSPVLQLEFKVFNNIGGKCIENELLAKDYIDEHIKLFEIYTIEEIDAERAKLKQFIGESIPLFYDKADSDRFNLYQAIDTVINETLETHNNKDIDEMHEAFVKVLEHVQTPKKALLENVEATPINEEVIEIAVKKFNEKYAVLEEDDKKLLQTLIKSSVDEKQELLETLKTESLAILEGVNEENSTQLSIAKAIQKIKEMVYNQETVNDDIIGLHDLKKGLL